MFDAKAMGEEVVRSVRDFCTRTIEPVTKRIDAIETQVRELPATNVEPEAIRSLVVGQVREAFDALPAPKNGEDGKSIDHAELASEIAKAAGVIVTSLPVPKDGKDADPEMVQVLVQQHVEKAFSALPMEVQALVQQHVGEAFSALPIPRNGEDGKDADPESVKALVQEHVDKALTANQHNEAEALREFTSELIAKFKSATHAG